MQSIQPPKAPQLHQSAQNTRIDARLFFGILPVHGHQIFVAPDPEAIADLKTQTVAVLGCASTIDVAVPCLEGDSTLAIEVIADRERRSVGIRIGAYADASRIQGVGT